MLIHNLIFLDQNSMKRTDVSISEKNKTICLHCYCSLIELSSPILYVNMRHFDLELWHVFFSPSCWDSQKKHSQYTPWQHSKCTTVHSANIFTVVTVAHQKQTHKHRFHFCFVFLLVQGQCIFNWSFIFVEFSTTFTNM